jgi:hypothetical protein
MYDILLGDGRRVSDDNEIGHLIFTSGLVCKETRGLVASEYAT